MFRAFGSVVGILLLLGIAAATAAGSPAVSSAGAESMPLDTPAATAPASSEGGLRDAAAMLLVGTALIGLATAVRRTA
jgi:hypothetical protein